MKIHWKSNQTDCVCMCNIMGVGLRRGYQRMGLNLTGGKQDFHEAIDVSVPTALAKRLSHFIQVYK